MSVFIIWGLTGVRIRYLLVELQEGHGMDEESAHPGGDRGWDGIIVRDQPLPCLDHHCDLSSSVSTPLYDPLGGERGEKAGGESDQVNGGGGCCFQILYIVLIITRFLCKLHIVY